MKLPPRTGAAGARPILAAQFAALAIGGTLGFW
jgi:hypothetical protein